MAGGWGGGASYSLLIDESIPLVKYMTFYTVPVNAAFQLVDGSVIFGKNALGS